MRGTSDQKLMDAGIIKNPRDGVKILGNGELTKKLTVRVNAFSESAKAKIEAAGGKVSSAVSAKTDYLVNNDINSTSAKNKKALELKIPIITEEELLEMIEDE